MTQAEIKQKNAEIIKDLNPKIVWDNFVRIVEIPRGSKNETAIGNLIMEFAEKYNLKAKRDKVGNIVVYLPASPGKEKLPLVCLQTHMDMVCAKTGESSHNFLTDSIELIRADSVIKANGTSLGSDNGIGMAYQFALMEDGKLEHGKMELLFTVDEETGLNGAGALQPDFIQSKILINLDSEDWEQIFMSCAGGLRSEGSLSFFKDNILQGSSVKITLKDFKGGHSGCDIHEPHENPIKVMGLIIELLSIGNLARLVCLEGGDKFNSIPTEAAAIFHIDDRKAIGTIRRRINKFEKELRQEIGSFEPKFKIEVERVPKSKKWTIFSKDRDNLCQLIAAIPHGVVRMSPDVKGLVQTSTNLASVRTVENRMIFQTMQRGSINSETRKIAHMVDSVFKLAGGSVKHSGWYSGWKANLSSPTLAHTKKTFMKMFNKEPEVIAIHAGLECGILGEKYPEIDMVSFGPTIRHPHSPNEEVEITTVEKGWDFLLTLISTIPEV